MTTDDTDLITLTVTADGLPFEAETRASTVLTFIGTDPETGENFFFAVDHRPAQTIIDAVRTEGEIQVAVEGWQITGKGAF